MKRVIILCSVIFSVVFLASCSEAQYVAHVAKQIPFPSDPPKTVGHFKVGNSYVIKGRRYYPKERYSYTEHGTASWYGPNFHGKMTANGEYFNKHELTAAHRTLQMPSIIRVTNVSNGRSLILRVNDRGPYAHNRILDVSERAATLLGFKKAGTARIKLEVLPEPSRQVAAMAKAGQNTAGFEVALNRNNGRMPATYTRPAPSIQQASLTKPVRVATVEPAAAPAPITPVQAETITPPALPKGNIYVQAGSFSSEQNALSLSERLSHYGRSKVYLTRVGNVPYFRVRLGPYTDRHEASRILTALNGQGNKNAVIVVD